MGTISSAANAPGTANVTVSVEDGRGGTGSTVFTVTVAQPNRNPIVDPIAPVTLNVGATVNVGFTASDPDGDLLSNPVAISDNGGIAGAFVSQMGTITLTANAPGSANITVSVDDGRGGTGSTVFTVTVNLAEQPTPIPPSTGLNLWDVPILPPLDDPVLSTVRDLYRRGQGVMNPGAFSVVGDATPGDFLSDLGDGSGNFDGLPDAGDLNDLVFYYVSTGLPVGGNSFQAGGALASGADWRAADLLNPALANGNVCQPGETPLGCELRVNAPAVVFVVVGRSDVMSGTPPDQFADSLKTIVQTIAGQGALPILTTIPAPDDPGSRVTD